MGTPDFHSAPQFQILPGDASNSEVQSLIADLDAFASSLYPPESNHFDPPEALSGSRVCFLVAAIGTDIVGCGAMKHCSAWGEIKRMYLRPDTRGKGIATALLSKLMEWARSQKLSVIRLETGHLNRDALKLYRRFGFTEIEAFPPYEPDPLSVFMEVKIGEPS